MATAGDVMTMVQQMCAMDIAEIGNDAAGQQAFLVTVINRATKELAHLAYRTKVSDPLNIVADGYQTFQVNGAPITDLYGPLRILNPSGTETVKRSSYSGPQGWWRESDAAQIHTKGLSGNHTLHYVAYPANVSNSVSALDFPEAGLMGLVFWCSGIVKESRNAYDEAAAMYSKGKERLKILVLSNIAARGTSSGGYVPSTNDVDTSFKM